MTTYFVCISLTLKHKEAVILLLIHADANNLLNQNPEFMRSIKAHENSQNTETKLP